MSTRVAERLDGWDSRSFTGGIQELQELADADFSGVIRAGGAELYMTTGTVVGIERGSIDDFADAQGTVFVSPSPALPLLAVMQAEDVDVRAQYYSEDTPMSEVDRTLSDGAFTGFIELSENVLSGDYYVVYHGGERMAVGFVGNNARLITDEEAFETADDEVGIYKVRQVEVEPVAIPDPSGEGAGGAAGGAAEADADAAEAAAGGAGAAATGAEAAAEPADRTREVAANESGGAADTQVAETTTEGAPEAAAEGTAAEDEADGATEDGAPATGAEAADDTAAETAEPSADATAESTADAGAESTADSTTERQAEQTRESTGSAGERSATEGSEQVGDSSPAASGEASTAEPDWQGSRSEPESAEAGGSQTADAAASADPAGKSREGSGRGTESTRDGSGGAGRSQRSTPARQPTGSGGSAGGSEGGRGRSGGSATDLETRSIPSLDPNLTKTPQRNSGGSAARETAARGRQGGGGAAASQQGRSAAGADRQRARQHQAGGAEAASADSAESAGSAPDAAGTEAGGEAERSGGESGGVARERVEDLQSRLAEREAEVERLETELERVETEKDDLREQLETAREERDDLAEQVDRLESELTRLEEELGAATEAEQRITAREALDGTDVFVRYRSKGDATLQKAHDGSVRQKDVTGNLRLEKHTQFDAARVAVGGKSYHEFLEARPEYQFIRWTVEELLFEIRDTGHADALQVLYDALPKVDRGELNGVIDVTFTDEGQETRTQETFDVVLRDRMGNPLLVANLNDSRQGATESMMSDLITAAERVGQSAETFAGAFLVTRSFFEPDALETAEEATRSGIFSRDKRKSFVNISRKRGFHLCLVEARNQNFHLTVPEL